MQNHGFNTVSVSGQSLQQSAHVGNAPVAMMGGLAGIGDQHMNANGPNPSSVPSGTGTGSVRPKLGGATSDGSSSTSSSSSSLSSTAVTAAAKVSDLGGSSGDNHGQRPLPDKDVNSDSIEDAYVQFILHCNPGILPETDTAELRRGFQSMPKTDGRTFDVFTLFQLIKKLEAKEIETWSQLVTEMGVKPPDVASGQSTQKVQQYAVRLKRWLHAYHIDAFFQYCFGKSNAYFTDVPAEVDSAQAPVRDGVPPEEDLALRALVPKWRPKRGRRPNDDGDPSPNSKRQLRASSVAAEENLASANPISAYPHSAYPQSAFPWDRASNQRDPWATAQRVITPIPQSQGPAPGSSQPPQQQRQQEGDSPGQPSFESQQLAFYMDVEPQTAHPQSAMTPHPQATTSTPILATPQSAHPLSSTTSTPASATSSASRRKRHGPTVSAAWANDGSTATGKLRGRPPANRTHQDGPFTTFPVRHMSPKQSKQPPPQQQQQQQQQPSPSIQQSPSLKSAMTTPVTAYPSPSSTDIHSALSAYGSNLFTPLQHHPGIPKQKMTNQASNQLRKPSKLQLQVPQHAGGPVRLATPPAQRMQEYHQHTMPQTSASRGSTSAASGGGARQQTPKVLLNGADSAAGTSGMGAAAGGGGGGGGGGHERRSSADFFNVIDDEASEVAPDEVLKGLEDDEGVDWKRRALVLKRKVLELEAELKGIRRRVLEAVM